MRVLGIGARVDLGSLYLALLREGHEVRVHASDPTAAGAFGGLVETVPDWRAELGWVGRDGVVLFEKVGEGKLQDELRAAGYRVVGGSALADLLEYDRAFGQRALRDAGLRIAESRAFAGPAEAAAWLARNPGRFVHKHDNNARATVVGEHPAGDDLLWVLGRTPPGRVLLMERLEGVEVGVGAYFDGRRFLRPACVDFEHKRFFPGEMGEMTTEMGTLAGFEGSERLFEATLDRVAPLLAGAGHVGYVNLNMIIDERGAWPLEFTCRFGDPGFAVLAPLQRDGWGDLFERMLDGGRHERFAALPGWSVGIVLTVPPFPREDAASPPEDDPPLLYREPPGAEELARHHHPCDVRLENGRLLARRRTGRAMVVTGTGAMVEAAQAGARARAGNVIAPDLRWRADIGNRFLLRDGARLRALGWLQPV
jgi:phosphoribosylamine--glycine ligase